MLKFWVLPFVKDPPCHVTIFMSALLSQWRIKPISITQCPNTFHSNNDFFYAFHCDTIMKPHASAWVGSLPKIKLSFLLIANDSLDAVSDHFIHGDTGTIFMILQYMRSCWGRIGLTKLCHTGKVDGRLFSFIMWPTIHYKVLVYLLRHDVHILCKCVD